MASNRIKGITIEIDGNTTKLQDSLKDVNKNLKDTQTQLRDVDKLLKLDPKNVELLAQKQELLGRQTENVSEKLKKLREAQQQMKDAGVDTMSDDYMALEREIISCEKEQEKLTEETKKTDTQILKCSTSMQDVADKAKKAADATKPLSTAAAGALTGMTGLAVKAGQTADEFVTMAKQSGFSTETLQKMSYAADLIDVDMNTAVGAATKLKKSLDKNEDTLKEMGVSTKDLSGNYRNIEDIFFETVEALSHIENETERDKVAMDLFGKSADELAGYIDDGAQAYKQLAAEAEASGRIISDEDLQKANEFNDTLDKLKATLGTDLLKAGASIGEALAPVLEKVADVITKIADGFANLSPTTQKIIMIVLALVAALSPVLSIIATIATMLPVLTPILAGVAGVLSGPVLLAIGAVVAAVIVLIKHWDDIKTAAKMMAEIVVEKWDLLKNKVITTIDTIKTKIETFKNTVQTIWNSIAAIFGKELPIPKLKLPHFKITGQFSLNPPSAPSFNVDWYKKAMDDAYILNGATIFGQQGGQLLGGGEAGSETVVGTEKLMEMMSEAVGGQNVTVVLQGDAAEIFRVVRQENSQYYKAHGYSPLMGA